MKKPTYPGFNAEAGIYQTRNHYSNSKRSTNVIRISVVPQLPIADTAKCVWKTIKCAHRCDERYPLDPDNLITPFPEPPFMRELRDGCMGSCASQATMCHEFGL